MPSLSDIKGNQLDLLHSLHRLHCEFAEHKYSFARVGITFEGLRGLNRTWEKLEQSGLIKVERFPGPAKSPQTATVWLTAGADVMKLDRIVETVDGEPVEWRVTFRKV